MNKKIPDDKPIIEQVKCAGFHRIGIVKGELPLDCSNAKALISYINHEEAYAAWKLDDTVFVNYFVKLS